MQPPIVVPGNLHNSEFRDSTNVFLENGRFRQTVTFQEGDLAGFSGNFTVTYSDYGAQPLLNGSSSSSSSSSREPKAVLICGPLLGTRYLHIAKDKLAKEYGLRIIHPDRPGFGGTTEVPIQDRIRAWLAIIPALLRHLGIKHVSLVAQSGGTIYALNTILHLRHLLEPSKPYVALCAPWIHPCHSGATSMQIVSLLPDSVLSRLDRVAKFFNNTINPISGPGSALGMSSSVMGKPFGSSASPQEATTPVEVMFEEALRPCIIDLAYAENIHGLSQDAMLFLKRSGRPDEWGSWVDYDTYVPQLAAAMDIGNNEVNDTAVSPTLRVEVFFAESDIMIGTQVREWFDDCWSPENRGYNVDYTSYDIEGPEHDSILDLRFGVARKIFAAIS